MNYAIGVDIGGTKIRFAAVNRQGGILLDRVVPTEAKKGAAHVMSAVMEGIGDLLEAARSSLPESAPAGIGVGSAGQIDFNTGRVAFAVDTLPGWTGTPIRDNILTRWSMPVYVDNDVNVVALAEMVYGAGRSLDHFVCLALGTGIGGAIVTGGELLRGVFGGAGELGHVTVDYRGPRCSCGNYGCVELYASGTGIARIAKEAAQRQGIADDRFPDAKAVVTEWLAGDAFAEAVMEEAVTALSGAVAGWIHTFNPQAVVIGGSVAEAGEPFFRLLREKAAVRTSPAMREACRIIPATVGNDSGVIGAAAQVWHYGKG
ncbi:ROK family protein [Paenibacillus thermotolerans]|uniref:ROK family protein n=1 Tax=Paenibacillus thermotolerans TaxID=3027807 RepID=UPI002367799B|nr:MULTISPECIES: ROK family protein [unclassified Paenibacillus]